MQLYIDTSVFGGYFEREFQLWTQKLVNQIFDGEFTAVISDITLAELETAPKNVRELADRIISENAEFVIAGQPDKYLAEKYVKEKIVSPKFRSDALHIAIATINKVDVLTSWNFKHIVNLNRIRQYNSVNLKYGYTMIEIRSPMEIVEI
ncbi:MAG: PIN domain-containing protein [Bacteroidota bacterium]